MFHYISYFFEHDYESKYLFSYQEKQYISIYSKRFHKTRRITPAKETFNNIEGEHQLQKKVSIAGIS